MQCSSVQFSSVQAGKMKLSASLHAIDEIFLAGIIAREMFSASRKLLLLLLWPRCQHCLPRAPAMLIADSALVHFRSAIVNAVLVRRAPLAATWSWLDAAWRQFLILCCMLALARRLFLHRDRPVIMKETHERTHDTVSAGDT